MLALSVIIMGLLISTDSRRRPDSGACNRFSRRRLPSRTSKERSVAPPGPESDATTGYVSAAEGERKGMNAPASRFWKAIMLSSA